METIFSKIIRKEIPAKIVYEDEICMAFHDTQPQAPVHILLIPKKEIVSLSAVQNEDQAILGHLMVQAPVIAKKMGLKDFRVITNSGAEAGQSVFHLHLHILGGRSFSWPPG